MGVKFTQQEEEWRIQVVEKQIQKLKQEIERVANFDLDKEMERAVEDFTRGRRT